MRNTLFYTTMTNHRPLGYTVVSGRYAAAAEGSELEPPRQFRVTAARDLSDKNLNNPAPPTLRNLLARSTQPIFSVSAMFRMNPGGGGCGACGH